MRLGTSVSLRATTPAWTASLLTLGLLVPACEVDTTTTTAEEVGVGTDEDEGVEWQPIPARGDIHIPLVVVNQGVDVPIAVDGEWVGPSDRNTYVVANRDMLLRAFWEFPEDWVPREIRAQLELRYPDGTTAIRNDSKVIDTPSFPGDLKRSFFFGLDATQVPPGVEFRITLWETEEGYEDQRESTTVIEVPISGIHQIGVQPEPAELKVILVPVRYNTGSCNTNTAEITEEQEQIFLRYIHEQNPVTEVIWEFRRNAPIEWNTTLTSLAELWQPLQQMRTDDDAPPNAYYYALVDACASGVGGAGGIAPGLPPPTKEAAYQRVSSGLWLNGSSYSYHTMVHELGHNQGRAHVFCAGGDAAGTDPAYPHDNGTIGVWGFGIRQIRLFSPTSNFDYMTYCSPNWVSDWTWSRNYTVIRTLTSWDYEGAAHDPGGLGETEVLIGLLMPNGEEKWWTTPGGREAEHFSGAQTVAFDYGDEIIERPAATDILDDGSTMVTVTVPRRGAPIQAATRFVSGEAHQVALEPTFSQ
jgi:hypothetical protein